MENNTTIRAPRRYDDPCGVARALNRIGERWALLVVRELLHGPKRFTDLRVGLASISPNVLSQRLRQLEGDGIVRKREIGPPTGATVYELTARGRDLEPVLVALAKWGSREPLESERGLSVDALLLALQTTVDREVQPVAGTFQLRFGADHVSLTVHDGGVTAVRRLVEDPVAVIDTDPATLRSLVFGGEPLREAVASGSVRIDGDEGAVDRLVSMFKRPSSTA